MSIYQLSQQRSLELAWLPPHCSAGCVLTANTFEGKSPITAHEGTESELACLTGPLRAMLLL